MDWENYFYLTGLIIMALLVTVMHKAKVDSFSKEELSMKVKLDITLPKEKGFLWTIYKNTGIWEAGLMTCRMEKAKKLGVMGPHTKGTFWMGKNMGKASINLQMEVFTRVFLNMINSMVKDI